VGDLEALAAEAEQFVWGGHEAAEVPALAARLAEARAWVSSLNSALKNKPALETLEALLAWDPPPINHTGQRVQCVSFASRCRRLIGAALDYQMHPVRLRG